ncbi:hypothetical protein B0H10DRAFT_2092085 [Mycena sp. CBHHK59/15]|nr:hypothetical protein B0H10DRAFT_2092085 [Mycena sp. CBHHK59/15]
MPTPRLRSAGAPPTSALVPTPARRLSSAHAPPTGRMQAPCMQSTQSGRVRLRCRVALPRARTSRLWYSRERYQPRAVHPLHTPALVTRLVAHCARHRKHAARRHGHSRVRQASFLCCR